MATYPGFTFSAARAFPLATALLMARHRADVRAGGDSADNPLVRAMINAREAVRKFALAHCTLMPGAPLAGAPPSPGLAITLAFATRQTTN